MLFLRSRSTLRWVTALVAATSLACSEGHSAEELVPQLQAELELFVRATLGSAEPRDLIANRTRNLLASLEWSLSQVEDAESAAAMLPALSLTVDRLGGQSLGMMRQRPDWTGPIPEWDRLAEQLSALERSPDALVRLRGVLSQLLRHLQELNSQIAFLPAGRYAPGEPI